MEQKRTTPEFITSLEPNEIFVFGSNLKGMHGGGLDVIDDELTKQWIRQSYELVLSKLPKKLREKYI